MGQSSLMWDRAVSQQSHVSSTELAHVGQSSLLLGQTSLKWVRAVLCGIEQHHMDQNSIMWVWTVSCGSDQSRVRQSSLFWDRAVSRGLDQSHVDQRSLIWDRAVSYGSDQSHVGQTSLMWYRWDRAQGVKDRIVSHQKKYLGHSAWYYSGREQSHVRKSNLM